MSNSVSHTTHLGRSAEDYLEVVYVASQSGRHVRVTDIANDLGVSKPSVVSALAGLKRKGLVRHERYRGVELTARGAAVADEVYRRHRFLTEFLCDVLGVPAEVAGREACEIEHVLSPETVERLVRMVEFYRAHGDERSVSLAEMHEWLHTGVPRPEAGGRRDA
jgi:DtxR family Mn-dependent transcriptional regulator